MAEPVIKKSAAPVAIKQKAHKNTDKETENFRGIVRVVGRDLEGHMTVRDSLRKIRGIGHNLGQIIANILERDLKIKQTELIGNLLDDKLNEIEEVIKQLETKGIKTYQLNRPNDIATGKPKHFVAADLQFVVRQDIELDKNMRSWRGWRHQIGQKVRGQHTRSTGRTGMSVGVLKKSIAAAKAAATAGAEKKDEKK